MTTTPHLADRLHIRLEAKYSPQLQAALKEVETGRGQNHLGLHRLLGLAARAEKAMDALELPKSARRGASFAFAKAGAECAAYRSAIATTRAVVKRDARGWYLADLNAIRQWPRTRVTRDVALTAAQSAILKSEKLRGYRYFIDKPSGPYRLGACDTVSTPADVSSGMLSAVTDDVYALESHDGLFQQEPFAVERASAS